MRNNQPSVRRRDRSTGGGWTGVVAIIAVCSVVGGAAAWTWLTLGEPPAEEALETPPAPVDEIVSASGDAFYGVFLRLAPDVFLHAQACRWAAHAPALAFDDPTLIDLRAAAAPTVIRAVRGEARRTAARMVLRLFAPLDSDRVGDGPPIALSVAEDGAARFAEIAVEIDEATALRAICGGARTLSTPTALDETLVGYARGCETRRDDCRATYLGVVLWRADDVLIVADAMTLEAAPRSTRLSFTDVTFWDMRADQPEIHRRRRSETHTFEIAPTASQTIPSCAPPSVKE